MVTGWHLMVMPRSRSKSMESRSWACISRLVTVRVVSSRRSDSVVFPWSMWAMIEKLRVWETTDILGKTGETTGTGRLRRKGSL